KWIRKADRPFTVSGRPQGDFWALIIGARDSKNVPWQIRHELSLKQRQQVLIEGKANGFRPESLFVCPGRARAGFAVVLTHDNPDLLWDVHTDLTSAQLESEVPGMVAKGYALDQVVGYAFNGVSHYLVCWTRDPHPYPATGRCDPSSEATDEALEQFL